MSRHLLLARGLQWSAGERGDVLARLLCGRDAAPVALLHRSALGPWVIDRRVGGAPAGTGVPDRATGAPVGDGRVLARTDVTAVGSVLAPAPWLTDPDPPATHALLEWAPVLGPAVEDGGALPRVGAGILARGPGTGDLVTGFTRPFAIAAAATLLGLADGFPHVPGLLDARLCPPRLVRARALVRSLDAFDASRCRGPLPGALRARGADETTVRTIAALVWFVAVDLVDTLLAVAVSGLAGSGTAPGRVAGAGSASAVVDRTFERHPMIGLDARFATETVDVGGSRIGAGEQVVVVNGAGPHAGTGDPVLTRVLASLVRAQVQAGLDVLLERGRGLRTTGPPVSAARSPVTRRICALPVVVGEPERP